MTRSEWKAAARARLGGGIFKDQWLMGVVFCLVVSAIVGAAGAFSPASARSSSPARCSTRRNMPSLRRRARAEALTSTICSAAFE